MLMAFTHTLDLKGSREVTVLAGASCLDTPSKCHLDGQKKLCLSQTLEALRYLSVTHLLCDCKKPLQTFQAFRLAHFCDRSRQPQSQPCMLNLPVAHDKQLLTSKLCVVIRPNMPGCAAD